MHGAHHNGYYFEDSDRPAATRTRHGTVQLCFPGDDYVYLTFKPAHIPALKALVALLEQQVAEQTKAVA